MIYNPTSVPLKRIAFCVWFLSSFVLCYLSFFSALWHGLCDLAVAFIVHFISLFFYFFFINSNVTQAKHTFLLYMLLSSDWLFSFAVWPLFLNCKTCVCKYIYSLNYSLLLPDSSLQTALEHTFAATRHLVKSRRSGYILV